MVADISVSVDGFVTGPGAGPDNGFGDGAEGLHAWVFSDDEVDRAVLEEATSATGAVVMGRKLFDVIDGPYGWSDEVGYGARHAAKPPFFVVTSSEPESVRLAVSHDFTFVLDGPAAAVAQARAVAGDKDVYVMGGGEVVRGCLDAGVVDQLSLHISPLVLGDGSPLFDGTTARRLTQRDVRVSPHAVHVIWDVED
ncbi:DNA-binding protein [Knoellia flava TL1]|uniref:DNA-binding protein n=2 Tax=Knoellia flava TaxID=913969 RepID=A0A8H9FTG1_9MICO|nr:DNA-binding protein [Knoellia flava TL1]GGB77666.1 DNA-binding protein [Knoellia flava]